MPANALPGDAWSFAASSPGAAGNFDPDYCKRTASREAVNDGNLTDWYPIVARLLPDRLRIRHVQAFRRLNALSARSESLMEQAFAPPFIMSR